MNVATASLLRPTARPGGGFVGAVLSALLATAVATVALPVLAADDATLAAEGRQAQRRVALGRAAGATVGVRVTAVEDARSNGTLGRERQGSGVVIGADGLVLTIGYLVLEADHVDLIQGDGHRVPARVVAYDLASGFGLLQPLAPLSVVPAPLGTSAAVGDGEPLLIVSGGDDADLSLARMVSRRSFAGYWEYHIDGALFTVPARTDHSGAGLFNAEGELVGIGSLVVQDPTGRGVGGMSGNMFVPVDLLKPVLAELRANGRSRQSARAWLGLNCVEYGGQVRVVRPTPDGPAEEAGLRPGDIVAAIDGVAVADLQGFYRLLWRDARAERTVVLDVRRGAETVRLEVRAVDRMRTLRAPSGV